MSCFDMCNQYSIRVILKLSLNEHKVRTPKTVKLYHTPRQLKIHSIKLKTDFPVILKSSTGTQTGVGVVVVESLRSFKALVQMTLLYNKYLPIIIQEYIKTDYDVRVLVCEGKVLAAMKRPLYMVIVEVTLQWLPTRETRINRIRKIRINQNS